jgi:hypothetical protein
MADLPLTIVRFCANIGNRFVSRLPMEVHAVRGGGALSMKNIFDVLRQKEAELQQLQKEIEALRVAARLLAEDSDPRMETAVRPAIAAVGPVPAPVPRSTKEALAGFEASPRQFP